MGITESRKAAQKRRVIFSVKAPEASEVCLLGDFNQWNVKAHPMKMDKTGVWKKILMLPPGRHEYKFLVDGRWETDPKNDEMWFNCYGTHNSVIQVGAK
jgi:1,4-alpha-glucan branching enzyme